MNKIDLVPIISEKMSIKKSQAKKAISLYNSGKAAEKAGNYKDAYRFYKNSYELYPLLYDTWERMKKIKKKL